MAGGFSSESSNQGMQDQAAGQGQATGYAPRVSPTPADEYYSTMVQPTQSYVDLAYQQAVGRAPEQAGRDYWTSRAQQLGWTGRELANQINQAGAAERANTGYQSQINPQAFTQSRLGTTPSYYNTNPYTVDYQNIFNPQAGSVLRVNPTMTPAQQAQYLTGWQQDYQSGVQRGLDQTKAERIAKADAAMKAYQEAKAKAETTNKDAINKAVQDALAQQQFGYTPPFNPDAYQGAGGAKAGGRVGIRSIK